MSSLHAKELTREGRAFARLNRSTQSGPGGWRGILKIVSDTGVTAIRPPPLFCLYGPEGGDDDRRRVDARVRSGAGARRRLPPRAARARGVERPARRTRCPRRWRGSARRSRALPEAQGAPALYHETITVSFVLLINERLARTRRRPRGTRSRRPTPTCCHGSRRSSIATTRRTRSTPTVPGACS